MSIKNFYSELNKGLNQPAYLLHSGDAYILKEAIYDVRKTIPEEARDFSFYTFDLESSEEQTSVGQVVDVLCTISFMGGKKYVVLEGIQKLNVDGLKVIETYLANPSPDAVLIMLYLIPEGSRGVKKTTSNRLTGSKQIPMALRDSDLPVWVKERASNKGLTFTSEAIEFLIGTVGSEAGLLASEIEKFASLGKEKLNKDDVQSIVSGQGNVSAFDLIDALKSRKAGTAMEIYKTLSQTEEPYKLLGLLNWHYDRAKLKPATRAKVFALLSEADFMVKSSGGSYPLELTLAKLLRI